MDRSGEFAADFLQVRQAASAARSQNKRSEVSVQANLRSRLSEAAETKDEANAVIVFIRNWN